VRKKVEEASGQKPWTDIDPIEANAKGAAIQAGVMMGQRADVLVLDVLPVSLGIETKGDVMTRLIDRNTTLPSRMSEIFSTADDDQTSVVIHVLQGELETASNNKSLGKFEIDGIAPKPRGVPTSEVSFDLDLDGILSLAARDQATGERMKIRAKESHGLAPAEITQAIARLRDVPSTTHAAPDGPHPAPRRQSQRPEPSVARESSPAGRRPLVPLNLFYSYSHKDSRLRDQLQTHLSLLKRQGLIDEWHDRMIGPGDEWEDSIDEHLTTADVVLLLVSADFLASDYCYEREMKTALERHEQGKTRVLPIILRAVDWHSPPSPIRNLQALPGEGRPVVDFPKRDRAWLEVTNGIRKTVTELLREPHRKTGADESL
jgi:hypothetical protein